MPTLERILETALYADDLDRRRLGPLVERDEQRVVRRAGQHADRAQPVGQLPLGRELVVDARPWSPTATGRQRKSIGATPRGRCIKVLEA